MIEDSPVGNKLVGFFRGQVILHLTHGYCKIYIPSVYPYEWKDKPLFIPPAELASSLFAGTNTGSGVFTYPNIGSIVWVFFANNDLNYPVYFASSLGGENAFGLYELIKDTSLSVSDKHMITSGKTHIEWYENGKLSVQVEDPDRRDVIIDYRNSYIGQISDDTVSARPICEKVENEELSNVHARIVLDNDSNVYGVISALTHHYDIIDDGIINLTNDNYIVMKNDGSIIIDTLSTYNNDGNTDRTNNNINMNVGVGNAIQYMSTFDSDSKKLNNSAIHNIITNNDAAWNFNLIGKSDNTECQIEEKSSTYSGTGKYRINDDKASTESFIDIETKTGDLLININDKSSGHTYIIMTKNGVLTIDTSDKVVIHAPNEIQLTSDSAINIKAGSVINMTAPTINENGSSAVNINGGGGDVVIAGTSLEKHTHPYTDSSGYIGSGVTEAPKP